MFQVAPLSFTRQYTGLTGTCAQLFRTTFDMCQSRHPGEDYLDVSPVRLVGIYRTCMDFYCATCTGLFVFLNATGHLPLSITGDSSS